MVLPNTFVFLLLMVIVQLCVMVYVGFNINSKVHVRPEMKPEPDQLPAMTTPVPPLSFKKISRPFPVEANANAETKVQHQQSTPPTAIAYVTLVSNEKYVDGALVLGRTLSLSSQLVKDNRCSMVALVPFDEVCADSRLRLAEIGWSTVPLNSTLGKVAARSWWSMTMDKLALLNLTDYERVLFLDVDQVVAVAPDRLFADVDLPDPYWIAGTRRKDGFGTGVMIVQPNATVSREIIDFYTAKAFNKSDKWYRNPNMRDGLVFRSFVGNRFRHIPTTGLVHYSGGWKPWYNVNASMDEVSHLPKLLKGRMTLGKEYVSWWRHYLDVCKRVRLDAKEIERWNLKWQSAADPQSHVWMMRNTKWEYTWSIQDLQIFLTNVERDSRKARPSKHAAQVSHESDD